MLSMILLFYPDIPEQQIGELIWIYVCLVSSMTIHYINTNSNIYTILYIPLTFYKFPNFVDH